jgi:hypothetical protein
MSYKHSLQSIIIASFKNTVIKSSLKSKKKSIFYLFVKKSHKNNIFPFSRGKKKLRSSQNIKEINLFFCSFLQLRKLNYFFTVHLSGLLASKKVNGKRLQKADKDFKKVACYAFIFR